MAVFEMLDIEGQIADQLLELLDLLTGGISHAVAGEPLPARLHELLGPRIVGVRPDALPPAQVTHSDLAADPSNTMRIFSSGVYLRRVAVFAVRTKDSVSWLRSRAATAFSVSDWDTSAHFPGTLPSVRERTPPQSSRIFLSPRVCHFP